MDDHVDSVAEPGDEEALRLAVLQFSREVAFATAHVYASFAENRGAWDARLEALVVDALVRGERSEELPGRAAALGWATMSPVVVLVGSRPAGVDDPHAPSAGPPGRCAARCWSACTPTSWSSSSAGTTTWRRWPSGSATSSARARWSPARSSTGSAGPAESAPRRWPGCAPRGLAGAPRPVAADALLAERALDGDPLARATCRSGSPSRCRRRRRGAGDGARGARQRRQPGGQRAGAVRAPQHRAVPAARAAELTGLSATDPRGGWTLQVALALAAAGPDRSLWH
jgi:hypothetical protein